VETAPSRWRALWFETTESAPRASASRAYRPVSTPLIVSGTPNPATHSTSRHDSEGSIVRPARRGACSSPR
jgi:hypothetical protein